MGVITTEHLDDSELHDDELAHWGPRVRESLSKDYIARIEALHDAGTFPDTDEGWDRLKAQAWAEAIAANEVCKSISCLSAQRRAERMVTDGSVATIALPRPLTAADIETVLRAANPEGELTHLDGRPVLDGHLDELAEMINDPGRRAAILTPYEVTPDLLKTTTDIVARLFRKGGLKRDTAEGPRADGSATLRAMSTLSGASHALRA